MKRNNNSSTNSNRAGITAEMKADIEKAVATLQNGGIILYPTDTVWGIGCDATRADAVEKIYNLKGKHEYRSMLILLGNENLLTRYVADVPEIAWQLLEVSDKPTTIIYPGGRNVAENLIPEDGSLGIRIPKDTFCEALLWQFKKPIVSTSANIHECPTPLIFTDIDERIKAGVDYVVNWKQNDNTKKSASSIIKLSAKGEIKIIRA